MARNPWRRLAILTELPRKILLSLILLPLPVSAAGVRRSASPPLAESLGEDRVLYVNCDLPNVEDMIFRIRGQRKCLDSLGFQWVTLNESGRLA